METPTPPEVAEAATTENALPMQELQLIGVYMTGEDVRAMLRGNDGTITVAKLNDLTPHGQVRHIDETGIVLENGPLQRRLDLAA